MNFSKQYILQSISLASNNLRLNPDRIETVAFLKDYLNNCDNLEEEIALMKTKTELSKFAIKLGEAYKAINGSIIDFLKITDIFKDHSHNLILELSNVLDHINVEQLTEILTPMEEPEEISVDLGEKESTKNLPQNIYNDVTDKDNDIPKDIAERDSLKEELILEEVVEHSHFDFADFEETILKPVAKLEKTLSELVIGEVDNAKIKKFISIMQKNAKLSEEIGFNILSEMHQIFSKALENIHSKKIIADKKLIESMRACLIVIVAIVRSKDVDITTYINKAEKLEKHLKSL